MGDIIRSSGMLTLPDRYTYEMEMTDGRKDCFQPICEEHGNLPVKFLFWSDMFGGVMRHEQREHR